MTTNDERVAEYLDRLRSATLDLPPNERDELLSSIAEHIATSMAELNEPTAADVDAILTRLGDPAAIAAEARRQSQPVTAGTRAPSPGPPPPGSAPWTSYAPPPYGPAGPGPGRGPWPGPGPGPGYRPAPPDTVGPATDRPGVLEWGGLLMLGVGSCLLPVVGTIAGLVMVCLSTWWSTRQKLLAVALSLSGAIIIPLAGISLFVVRSSGDSPPGPAPVEYYETARPTVVDSQPSPR